MVPAARLDRPGRQFLLCLAHESAAADWHAPGGPEVPQWMRDERRYRPEAIVPFRTLPDRSSSWGGTIVMLRGKSRLVFRPQTSEILRFESRGYSGTYERLRREFAAAVPSAGFRIVHDGTAIEEELVDGVPLRNLEPRRAEEIIVRLLAQLGAAVEQWGAIGHGPSDAWLRSAASSAPSPTAGGDLDRGLIAWLGASPLVPSHGDLHGPNVIARPEPVCIDFDTIDLRPAWFDGMTLVLRSVSWGLVPRHAVIGPFEEYLRRVVPGGPPDGWWPRVVEAAESIGVIDRSRAAGLRAEVPPAATFAG
jgi:hypothetical protein